MCGSMLHYRFVTLVDDLICDVSLSQGYTGPRGRRETEDPVEKVEKMAPQ